MARFADAPFFMLNDYINLVVSPSNEDVLDSDIVLYWEDVLFTDVIYVGGETRLADSSPYVDATTLYPGYSHAQIFEHDDVQWNAHWDTNPNASYFLEDPTITGVLMRGMEKSIIVKGGQFLDLFAKIDDEENPLYGEVGFAPVRLKPLYEEPREKIYFRFDIVEVAAIQSDPTFTVTYDSENPSDEPYYDSDYIEYTTFDYSYDTSISNQDALQAGTEIYFRKDGAFHEWLKLHANEFYLTELEVDFIIRNYVNTDKRFLYFGKIYPTAKDNTTDLDRYHIIFHGLKDWIQRAVPSNNRTENLIEWNDTYFDKVHWEGYQLLKDIWSLRDSNECDEKYLPYIPTFYGIPLYNRLDDNFTPVYREYARDLVNLMKRKGTYASLYIIYDLFSSNSPNIFNVYERWHTTAISGNETIGEVDTEITLDTANFTAGGANPETVTIDGTKIGFNMPANTQATATLDNIILDATQDITLHTELTMPTDMYDTTGATIGFYINDGTRDVCRVVGQGNAIGFSVGGWTVEVFNDAADGGTGAFDGPNTVFTTPETANAYVNYNATTRVLSLDFDDGGSPEPQINVTLRSDIGTEWQVRYEGIIPSGASGGSGIIDVELLYIDSGTVQTTGGAPIVKEEQYEDYIYTGLYGRREPTDDVTDTYGYIVSTTDFADPPTNSQPFYIDQNNEVIVATDGNGVVEENLIISNTQPINDEFGSVYINRGATTFTLTKGDVIDEATFDASQFTTTAGTAPTFNGTDMLFNSSGTATEYNQNIPIETSTFTTSIDVSPNNLSPNTADQFSVRFVDTDSNTVIFSWIVYPGTSQNSIQLYRGGVWAEWEGITWDGTKTYTLELAWSDLSSGRITGYTVYEDGVPMTPTTDFGVPASATFVDDIQIRYDNGDFNGSYVVSNQNITYNYSGLPDSDVDVYGYLYDTTTGAYIDSNGDIITYDGINPIFQSLLLLDSFSQPTVDGSGDNYIDLFPYIQKVPLQRALLFPQGAGEFWYAKSDTSTYPDGYVSSDDRMLSPYYRADLDLNVEPITDTKILPRNVSENLYLNWEYMRPINRQAEYNLIYAPFTDLTGQSWSLYEHPFGGQSVTTALDNTTFDADNFIYIERDNNETWRVTHNLNTDKVLVYTWDENFTKMVPDGIRVIDENVVEFEFPEGRNGLAVVSRATEVAMTQIPSEPTTWRILHAFSRDEVIMQFRFDADEYVYYPEIVRVSDFDSNYAFAENLEEPTRVFVQKGLRDGDLGLLDTNWYKSGSTWIINVYPEIENNFFNINCYDSTTNRRIEPRDIIFEDAGDPVEPRIRIEFDQPVDGWAAITDVGSVISFYGIIPRDAAGNMLPVEWRLEVQTETDIYTFLTEGSADADKFANSNKTIHYGQYVVGETDLEENDDDWWYYTFKVSRESLEQLGIRDYDITGVELVNTRVNRVDKQRIIYSRLSGIWKPFEANFVGHVRIFKDLNGLNVQLLDSLSQFLYDSESDILTE
jgi:hypothetical protein